MLQFLQLNQQRGRGGGCSALTVCSPALGVCDSMSAHMFAKLLAAAA